MTVEEENRVLRRLLWEAHACPVKYGDDGELQCNSCLIDFKRDSVEQIEKQLFEARMRRVAEFYHFEITPEEAAEAAKDDFDISAAEIPRPTL